MGRYRIIYFPNGEVPYKHIYLKRKKSEAAEKTRKFDEALEKLERKVNEKKLDNNIVRAKTNITNICLCNDFEYFCTFEFRDDTCDRYDVRECYKKIRRFFNNYQQKVAPDFRYLIIPEFHPKTNAIHFHGLCSGFAEGDLYVPETIQYRDKKTDELKQIPNKKHYRRWDRYTRSLGFFDCSPVRSRNAVAFYITKYVTKELSELPKGVKIYCCSQGLERPRVIEDTYDVYDMPMTAGYEDEFCKIAYDKYDETLAYFTAINAVQPFTEEMPHEYTETVEPETTEQLPYYAYDYGTDIYNEEYEIEYEQERLGT